MSNIVFGDVHGIKERKISLRKYIGLHGIHGLGTRDDKIVVYHVRKLSHDIKNQIETEASPFSVEWQKELPPVAG